MAPKREQMVQARAVKRAGRVEARRVQAEERKEAVRPHYFSCHPSRTASCYRMAMSLIIMFKGNAHFRAGDYRKAIDEYDATIKIHGPSAPYLSNMAAAWLKLEE